VKDHSANFGIVTLYYNLMEIERRLKLLKEQYCFSNWIVMLQGMTGRYDQESDVSPH